jgi:uncharacterized protein (TIRG00374 family)
MSPHAKKTILIAVKLAVAAALLGVVFSKAHWNDYLQLADGTTESVHSSAPVPEGAEVKPGLATALAQTDWAWLALAAVSTTLAIIGGALRWGTIMHRLRLGVRYTQSVKLGYLGEFFNIVVPGTMGGDLAKVYYIHKATQKPAEAIISIFIDRLVGMSSLLLIAMVMLSTSVAMGINTWESMRGSALTLGIIAICFTGGLAFVFWPALRRVFRLDALWRRTSVAHHFQAAGESVAVLTRQPRTLVVASIQSLFVHGCFTAGVALIGVAMGLDVPFYNYFIFVPLIYIIGAVPLTPGGVGVIEGLYLTFFAGVCQADASQVVAMAMLVRIVRMALAMPGLAVLITGPKLPAVEQMQHEIEEAEDRELERHNESDEPVAPQL